MTTEEMQAMLDSYSERLREDMSAMLDARFPPEALPNNDAPSEEEMEAEAARMDALVTARAEQRRAVAEVATRAGVEWNPTASVYANMRGVLESKIPSAYRADASDEQVVGMFEVFAASLAATAPDDDDAGGSRNDGFDGFHAFSMTAPKPGARNDANAEDPLEETLNLLAAKRAER